MTQPVPSSRRLRLLSAGVLLIVLLGIVAFASRSGIGTSTETGPSTRYLSYAYTAFLIVFALAIPATLWALWVERASVTVDRPSFRNVVIRNLLTFFVLCLAIGGALYLKEHHALFRKPDTSAVNNANKALAHKHGTLKKVEPTFQWPVLWVALGLLAIVSVPLAREHRRRRAFKRERMAWEPGLGDQLTDEISLAIDDLRAERDVRRAIVAAYARMERVLAQSGLRRRASETAFEYLGRVLEDLRVTPDAARALTGLFEEAKFSRHALGEDARSRAIGALETVRADLLPEAA